MKALLFFLAAGSMLAAIDGTVVNKTSGKPQAGVSITLVKPGQQGMQTLGTTVTDAAGHFVFEKDQPGGGPQLLQASYKGVSYNKLMTPNIPTSNVEVDVYEATTSAAVARVSQHMMLIEPTASSIGFSENIVIQNDSVTTYSNSSMGSVRFYLPPAANGQAKVQVQGPQGMPLPRPAEKTETDDVYKVDYAIKPGETQFEIDYAIPAGSPFTFHGRAVGVKGMAEGPLRLIAPLGVTLAGKDIESNGREPKTQATVFTVKASGPFSLDISGIGSLRGAEPTEADANDSPPVTTGPPRIYQRLGWLLTLALAILGVGLVYLYLSSPASEPGGK